MSNIIKSHEYINTYNLFKTLKKYIDTNGNYSMPNLNSTELLNDIIDNIDDDSVVNESDNKKLFKGSDESTNDFNVNKTFVDLIKQAIKCELSGMEIDKIDTIENTNGLFKFITHDGTTINNSTMDLEKVTNIIASLNVINVIIDIYDAYAHFIKNNSTDSYKDIDNIIIVSEKNIKQSNSFTENKNSGYYIKSSAGDHENVNDRKIKSDVLFLSINDSSFNSEFFNNYAKAHKLTDTESDSALQYSETSTNYCAGYNTNGDGIDLFDSYNNLKDGGGSFENFIYGVYIKKNGHDLNIIDETHYGTDTPINLKQDYNGDISTLKIRNEKILMQLMYYIFKLKPKDRYNGIYSVINLFRMFKVYINLAITSGNILFNRVFKNLDNLEYAQDVGDGFVFSYIDNEKIKIICDEIYHSDTITAGNISLIENIPDKTQQEASNDDPDNTKNDKIISSTFYGCALKENQTYYNEIVLTINKLKHELAESVSLRGSEYTLQLSDGGFEAIVSDENTITIKRRKELIKKLDAPTTTIIGIIDSVDVENLDDKTFKLSSIYDDNNVSKEHQEYIYNEDVDKVSGLFTIKINEQNFEIVGIKKDRNGQLEFKIKARLEYSDYYSNIVGSNIDILDAPILKLPTGCTIFDNKYSKKTTQTFSSYKDAYDGYILFHNILSTNNVELSKKDSYDYNNKYIDNVKKIKNINSNINFNESKIKNYESIYNTYKSRYDFMYNQFMAYSIIISILVGTMLFSSISTNNLATTKIVTIICLGIVVLLFVTYYVFNVLYMNEHFTNKKIEKFGNDDIISRGYVFPIIEGDKHKEFEISKQSSNFKFKKVNYVQIQLDSINMKIIQDFELLNIAIRQNDSNYAFGNLMKITTNEKNSIMKIDNILDNKKFDTSTHIDLLKYEIAVYRIRINTLLYSALAAIGIVTVNLYTEGKYYANLTFVATLLAIVIITYYIIYGNHIVRTESSNFYWGKEYNNGI